MWRYDSAKIARKEVALWFATPATGPVFLPGDGRVLPLGAEEAKAIRASAEEKAVAWIQAVEVRIWIAIGIIIAVVFGSQALAARLDEPWKGGIEAAAIAMYTVHGVWALYEVFENMKQMRTLRGAIAQSLAGRVPLPAQLAGGLGRGNPIRTLLIGTVMALLVWNLLAEFASHWKIDLIGWMPGWLPLVFIAFVYVAALGNWWLDRSRGIGVLPSEDLAARVRDRLDRERLGG